MSSSDEILNAFMMNKNKEVLGEKVEKQAEKDDNFLNEVAGATNRFMGESISNNDNSVLIAKKTMSAVLTVPIIMGGIFSGFYIVLKVGPHILNFIRKIFIVMWL